ncbi:MAG: phage terminase small subunit-related protein [Desulfomonilaceae bacterium]
MMKKEARLLAENMFLAAKGKITNKEIAQALHVNALTVGRWRKEDHWERILSEQDSMPQNQDKPTLIRKRNARDLAERLYLEAGGNITNKKLAASVGVSSATISKWKELDRWIEKIQFEPATNAVLSQQGKPDDIDVVEMISPRQILEINRKIDQLLAREHLGADEIVDLATAKNSLLAAVAAYISIRKDLDKSPT